MHGFIIQELSWLQWNTAPTKMCGARCFAEMDTSPAACLPMTIHMHAARAGVPRTLLDVGQEVLVIGCAWQCKAPQFRGNAKVGPHGG